MEKISHKKWFKSKIFITFGLLFSIGVVITAIAVPLSLSTIDNNFLETITKREKSELELKAEKLNAEGTIEEKTKLMNTYFNTEFNLGVNTNKYPGNIIYDELKKDNENILNFIYETFYNILSTQKNISIWNSIKADSSNTYLVTQTVDNFKNFFSSNNSNSGSIPFITVTSKNSYGINFNLNLSPHNYKKIDFFYDENFKMFFPGVVSQNNQSSPFSISSFNTSGQQVISSIIAQDYYVYFPPFFYSTFNDWFINNVLSDILIEK